MYEDILTLIQSIYGIVRSSRRWFTGYIKNTNLKAGFKQCNTDPCILYILNELETTIFIVYVYYMSEIMDKP